MAQWIIDTEIDLAKGKSAGARQQSIQPLAYPGNAAAHGWRVTVMENGYPYIMSGHTITAYLQRADGNTVLVQGTANGNVAQVVFPAEVYAVPGVVHGIINATVSGQGTTALDAVSFTVRPNLTRNIIDPGSVIPASIDDLLAIIGDAQEAATNAANATKYIADMYDATKTYAVGDYVIYNGKLYRCNTTISTAEAWTAAHWTETQVVDDVGELKSALEHHPIGYTDIVSSMVDEDYFKKTISGTATYQSVYKTLTLPAGKYIVVLYDMNVPSVGYFQIGLTTTSAEILSHTTEEGGYEFTLSSETAAVIKLQINLATGVTAGTYYARYAIYKNEDPMIPDYATHLYEYVKLSYLNGTLDFEFSNNEFLCVTVDEDGRVIEGQTKNNKVFNTPITISGSSTILNDDGDILETTDENGKQFFTPVSIKDACTMQNIDVKEYAGVVTDENGKIVFSVDNHGTVGFNRVSTNGIELSDDGITELYQELKSMGYGSDSPTNWSEASELAIPTPQCAVVNITSKGGWPQSKFLDLHAWLEFWDCNGNYFKKRIIFNAQGNSSLAFEKKNGAFDICNDEWVGDDTFKLRIGEWVPQDSYHLKAYYTDFFRGVAVVAYQLMDEVVRTRGMDYDRPWKKALWDVANTGTVAKSFGGTSDISLMLDTGARNFPDGFPCKVFLNESFYGIYSWQLKKHRDNFHMTKDDKHHVWLDGEINELSILGRNGDVVWTDLFEVRNPKNLYLMDGTKYDADFNYGELIDATSEYYDLETDTEKVKKAKQTSAAVKQYIIDLSVVTSELKAADTAYNANPSAANLAAVKNLFELHFDVDELIDYQIVSDVIKNSDGFSKNWQWATYDGVKWHICIYDVDVSFGGHFQGNQITNPVNTHLGYDPNCPNYYAVKYYANDLNARYAELRDSKIIDVQHISEMLNSWCIRLGTDTYKKEYKKWSDTPCYGDSELNEQWELVPGEMGETQTYNALATYNADDTCTYGISAAMGYYKFKAKEQVTGVPPVKKWRYNDSIYRIQKWLVKSLENMDTLYQYNG